MGDVTPQGILNQLSRLRKSLTYYKDILYTNTALSGPVDCSYSLGIDGVTGNFYYRDANDEWALKPSGGGGGGTFDATVEFSVNADPNIVGTTFSPNNPALDTVLYVSTIDFSQWIYYSGAYHSYTAPFWTVNGNPSVGVGNFIGSINNQALRFRTNNILRGQFDTSGNFGINATPTEKLDVGGNIKFSGALMPNNLSGSSGQILLSQGAGTSPLWSTLSLAAIGASPNANGASISGLTINLQPASASFGGVITTGSQTIEGTKTFNQDIIVRSLRFGTGNDNDITNTAGGYQALNSTFVGSIAETAFGYQALRLDQTGTNNSGFGATSLANLINGYNNAAFGSESGFSITSGSANSLLGYGTGSSLTLGNNNIGIGNGALYLTTSGSRNIHIYAKNLPTGFPTATGITNGNANVIIGGSVTVGNVSNNIILADGDGNIRFRDDNTNTILSRLAGSGTRMVTALSDGTLATATLPGTGTPPLSDITAATAINVINNAGYTQTWNWNALSSGNIGLALGSASPSMSGNESVLSAIIGAGAVAPAAVYASKFINSGQVTGVAYGLSVNANNSGFSATGSTAADFLANGLLGTNIAGRFTASGGSAQYAIIVPASGGRVGFGNSAPTEQLDVTGNVKFSGALMPNNTAGTSGNVLTSQGAGTAPIWTAPSGGSVTLTVSTKTANYTITGSDDVILADATSGNITITLPTAVGVVKAFTVKRIDGSVNTLTLATTSSQTIDGSTTFSYTSQYQSLTVVSNNANWFII